MTPIGAYLTSAAPSAVDPFTLSSLSTLTGRTDLHIIAGVMVIANGALSLLGTCPAPCNLRSVCLARGSNQEFPPASEESMILRQASTEAMIQKQRL